MTQPHPDPTGAWTAGPLALAVLSWLLERAGGMPLAQVAAGVSSTSALVMFGVLIVRLVFWYLDRQDARKNARRAEIDALRDALGAARDEASAARDEASVLRLELAKAIALAAGPAGVRPVAPAGAPAPPHRAEGPEGPPAAPGDPGGPPTVPPPGPSPRPAPRPAGFHPKHPDLPGPHFRPPQP